MFGLHIVDIGVMVAYFSVVIYIGYRAMKKIKGQEDFFLGGRSFGKFLQTFSMFGQATSAESAVSMSSTVAQKGLAGVFFTTFQGLFSLPVIWFIPLWMRRSRLMTLADLFVERFQSKRLAALYSVAQVCMFMLVGAMGLQAMSKTIMAVTPIPVEELSIEQKAEYDQAMQLETLEAKPMELLSAEEIIELDTLQRQEPRSRFSYFNKTALIIGMALFVMLYAAGGGLEAAVWTDAIQSIFILLLTVLLIPFAMIALNTLSGTSGILGAFQTVHRILPGSMLELFGSPKLAGFTWYYMLLLTLVGTAGGFAYSNNLVVYAAAKSEDAARYGAMNGIVLKRISTVFWAILALFLLSLYGASVNDPDLLWGVASKELLPVGLLGLMLACLMAALMSSTDTHMVVISGLITNNIYKPLVGDKSDKHYLNAGRLFGLVHISGGVLVALFGNSNLFEMLIFMMLINVTMGPSVLMAFLWRRSNTSGVWCSMGVSLLLTLFIPVVLSLSPMVREAASLHLEVTPAAIVREYTAREWDVSARQKQIDEWNALAAAGKATGECPAALSVNERFEQSYAPPAKAVFWAKGIKFDDGGKAYGAGLFRPELFLIHTLGFDMSSRSVATIESLSLAFKLIFPFMAIILFGIFGKQNDDQVLDKFYSRLLTAVDDDPEQDAKRVAEAAANPRDTDQKKLWPASDWYIRRWDWQDWQGIIYAIVAMVGIGGLMWVLATLGM
jgi:SSS family solute:Na+ symporter